MTEIFEQHHVSNYYLRRTTITGYIEQRISKKTKYKLKKGSDKDDLVRKDITNG